MPRIPAARMKNVTITGPLWSARVDILSMANFGANPGADSQQDWAFRTLFLDLTPRQALGKRALLPGSLIVLCAVQNVTIRPKAQVGPVYQWKRRGNVPVLEDRSPAALRQQIIAGELSLLLVQTAPDGWPTRFPSPGQGNRHRYWPASLTCLAGEILLGRGGLTEQNQAGQKLYAALPIESASEAFPHRSDDFLPETEQPSRLLSEISVHSSGVSLYGQVQLPWQAEGVTVQGPFALSQDFTRDDADNILLGNFRLRPERERLTPGEATAWANAWNQLSSTLNPAHPLNQTARSNPQIPQWVTLELTTPTQIPDLFWRMPTWGGSPQLQFEPDEFSLIVSDRPPYEGQNPPDSLARVAPNQVTISTRNGHLRIEFEAGTSASTADDRSAIAAGGPPDQLSYHYQKDALGQQETLSTDGLQTTFSPVEVPRFLRSVQGLAEPEWAAAQPITPATLWGFMPLENGWAQLPFANLTEQIYLDSDLENPLAETPSSLLQGAVALGNEAVLAEHPNEQPWNLTWTDAERVRGVWELGRFRAEGVGRAGGDGGDGGDGGVGGDRESDGGFELQQITLTIDNPTVTLNGLFWLSTEAPRIVDALPDLDNWVNGLRSFALKTARPERDLFPSLALMAVQNLILAARRNDTAGQSAALQAWQLDYRLDNRTVSWQQETANVPGPVIATVFDRMITQAVLPGDFFEVLPLIWQRHGRLPMVQALPLTQVQRPSNYPSSSRQLIPYGLGTVYVSGRPEPNDWQFSATGAETWLQITPALPTAEELRSQPDLPLVSLSLPGLLLEPRSSGPGLAQQYRFDLPYTDEINAFAQLPEPPQSPEAVSPLPTSPPPEPPQPLTRETYGSYWQRLSERASLASADGVFAFDTAIPADSTREYDLHHLIEPYPWPVQPDFQLGSYPGTLSLQNSSTVELTGESALAGIFGQFLIQNEDQNDAHLSRLADTADDTATAYTITAGSQAAQPTPEGLRDQRGLARGHTQASEQWLQTPVQFHRTADQVEPYALTTAAQPVSLQVGSGQWQIWFRDLPLRLATATQPGTGAFQRRDRLSDLAQDVNDPDARSRDRDFLSGYEWRLAPDASSGTPSGAPSDAACLPLFNLDFYPLTLEQVSLSEGEVQQVIVIGRLQLPLSPQQELEDFSNAIKLTFTQKQGELALSEIALVADQGEWPLALEAGEASDAPLLVWKQVDLDPDGPVDGPVDGLVIKDAMLKFVLFDQLWSVPLSQVKAGETALRFTQAETPLNKTYTLPQSAYSDLVPQQLELTLDLSGGSHAVTLDLDIQLGPAETRSSFAATVQFPILENGAAAPPRWQTAQLLGNLPIAIATASAFEVSDRAFQFHWQTATAPSSALQLLPGMPLKRGDHPQDAQNPQMTAPGFVALTFDLQPADSGVPALVLTSGFVEALLACQWGEFLQTEALAEATDEVAGSYQQVFGSSAGDFTCGYTADWQPNPQTNRPVWHETILLNGMMEIKSLVSWPQGLALETAEGNPTLMLPSLPQAIETRTLPHHRHTLRILLNQHRLPTEQLIAGNQNHLFQLAPNTAWQFLAVVEHQLIDVRFTPPENTLPENISPENISPEDLSIALKCDRRWTVTQALRWLTPAQLKTDLATLTHHPSPDPTTGINTRGAGYFDPALRQDLLNELDTLPDPPLLVEASAHHWLHQAPLTTISPTTLQSLPNGAQFGILSSPSQYGPSDPTQPQWLLLTLPFLGRLQVPSADGLDFDLSALETAPSPLQVDPILCLTRQQPSQLALMLATWQTLANGAAARLPISGFDTALGRTWARLDPHSLQESWFRLQHPVTERSPSRLQSVLAATPDSPARLSRATALHQSFDSHRLSVPPTASARGATRDSASDSASELASDSASISAAQRGLIKTQGFVAPEGLQVLYRFQAGSGTTVIDVSEIGNPINLNLSESFDPNRESEGPHWRWDADGLVILRPSILTSQGPATKLIEACQRTHELTIEAWIEPTYDHLEQDDFPHKTGPWRIITLSSGQSNRNFTLGQGPPKPRNAEQHQPNFYVVRLRSTQTDQNGVRPLQSNAAQPMLVAPRGTLATRLSHVVYTRDTQGVAKLYLDGAEIAKTTVQGNFSNWDDSFRLALANELLPDDDDDEKLSKHSRPWLGKYYRVALYNRALKADEIQQQFAQGYAGPAQIIPHPWSTSGLHIATSQLAQADISLTRYAAATLLPTATTPLDPPPQSLAISPYLGLTFQPAGKDDYHLTLISAELLCFDRAVRSLRPIASHLWEVPAPSETAPNPSVDVYTASLNWANGIHTRLCPESPLAVLRFREIWKRAEGADDSATAAATVSVATVITGYRYQIVTDLMLEELPLKRVFRLRSEVPHLRFKEGQWGGVALPSELQPFELAPPQTTGAQPIYLRERPGLKSYPNENKWPWGLSTLRVSVQPTPTGVTGTLAQQRDRTLWWQAPQYTVQYRSQGNRPTAGLPAQFRARAITSLLPTALTPPMPAIDAAEIFALEAAPRARWQAILPSTMRYLLLGNRPGVFFNLRNQLLRQGNLQPTGQPTGQTHGSVFVSGSVPVQHRMPRPVPLPPNSAQPTDNSLPLQPWASYFEPTQTVLVTDAPADEAFFGAAPQVPARRLQMRLTAPTRGAILPDWDGQLQFEVIGNEGRSSTPVPLEAWDIEVAAIAGSQTIQYEPLASTVEPPPIPPQPAYRPVDSDALKNQLALLSAGATLTIQARVKPTATIDGFRQTLSFELRAVSDRTLPLPLQPQFLQFEDPEYNRQLASPTAHASTQVALILSPGSQPELIPLRLATDRREYNPDSVLAWRYDWANSTADGQFPKRALEIKRLRTGVETRLSISERSLQTMTVQTGQLNQIPLAQLLLGSAAAIQDNTAVLQPNDTLQLSLQLFKATSDTAPEKVLLLSVTLVADPVQPSPEAAYGLLRKNPDGSVECVRFAWGPLPNRVDLINPEDLRTEVARRRALFRWIDTKRAQHSVQYAIQKITQTGSTAFPNFEPDFEHEIGEHTA